MFEQSESDDSFQTDSQISDTMSVDDIDLGKAENVDDTLNLNHEY